MFVLLRMLVLATLFIALPAVHAQGRSECERLSLDGAQGSLRIKSSLVTNGFSIPENYYPALTSLHFGASALSAHEPPLDRVDRAFCRVEGVAPSAIRFEVWMPTSGWNGRMLGVGNQGIAGSIPYHALKAGVEAGYAVVGSDLGHQGGFIDGRFMIGRPELLVDWGYRATHLMTEHARAAIGRFYGRAPAFSYFAGCSGGGRQALSLAQRYPSDYDGILAGDPTINFTTLTMAGRLWTQLAMMREQDGAGYIPSAKMEAVARAVIRTCDKIDGVGDGIIEDPRMCRFDPAQIQCENADGPDCLTSSQVRALRQIYQGAHDSKGRSIFTGYSPGGELGPGGWTTIVTGDGPYRNGHWAYAQGVLPSLLYANPDWDMRSIDYDKDVERALNLPILGEPLGKVVDAYEPDLSAFAARGGKLIHYHGWSDSGVPPMNSINYYQSVVDHTARMNRLSAHGALLRTQNYYKLFMVPGMQHCIGGPGHDLFDGLTPLRDWVEKRQSPDRIIARHANDGQIESSRPLCAFPAVAHWSAKGDVKDSKSFVCRQSNARLH